MKKKWTDAVERDYYAEAPDKRSKGRAEDPIYEAVR